MKKEFISLFVLAFVCLASGKINAQETDNTDSLQRVMMKDSLSLSDTAITQVFAIRDSFLVKTAALSANSSFTKSQREAARLVLINQTNDQIQTVLGGVVFEQYRQMIRRRMIYQPGGSNSQPLASPPAGN